MYAMSYDEAKCTEAYTTAWNKAKDDELDDDEAHKIAAKAWNAAVPKENRMDDSPEEIE